MTVVLVSAPAEGDMEAINDYLAARAGVDIALRYAHEFDRLFSRLERHPQIGSPRRGENRSIRQCLIAPFLVFYDFDPEKDLVRIVRVLHERRSISDDMLDA